MTEITCDIFVCVVGVWQRDFLERNMKSNVKFLPYSSKIVNLDNSPDPLHRLLSKLAILELQRTNFTLLFILHSKNHAAKHRLRTQKYHK